MNDTTDSTEQMPMVPGADGYEQRADDGRDETLLMSTGAEMEAEQYHRCELSRCMLRREPSAQVHPAVGEGLHLAECNQVDTNDKTVQRCLRRINRRCPQEESDGRQR